jgi:hypothetical protein
MRAMISKIFDSDNEHLQTNLATSYSEFDRRRELHS